MRWCDLLKCFRVESEMKWNSEWDERRRRRWCWWVKFIDSNIFRWARPRLRLCNAYLFSHKSMIASSPLWLKIEKKWLDKRLRISSKVSLAPKESQNAARWKITLENYTKPHAGGHTFIFIHNPYSDDTQRNRILCNLRGLKPPPNHKKKVTKRRAIFSRRHSRFGCQRSFVLRRILTHKPHSRLLWHNYWIEEKKSTSTATSTKRCQNINFASLLLLLVESLLLFLALALESLLELHFGEWTFFFLVPFEQ